MRAPWWWRRRRSRDAGTVTVTLELDNSRFVAGMHDAAASVSTARFRIRVAHERSLGQAYVGTVLDDLCRDFGLDPVQVWRLPRAREELLAGLTHPDRATRQAAEAAWLRAAREHQRRRADGH